MKKKGWIAEKINKSVVLQAFIMMIVAVALGGLIGVVAKLPKSRIMDFHVEAPVVSINENIMRGESIGRFLGSPSGQISNDVVKVGVAIQLQGNVFLRDLQLNHAELAYYGDRKSIPLSIRIKRGWEDDVSIWLNGRSVHQEAVARLSIKKET